MYAMRIASLRVAEPRERGLACGRPACSGPATLLLLLLPLLIHDPASAVAARNGPVPVSPGSPAGQETVPGHCPTFSWAPGGEVDAYEVRVYRTPAPAEELAGVAPVLSARVPGTASSWTPAQPRCLEEGTAYSWTVVPLDGAELEGAVPALLSFRVASGSLSPAAAERLLELVDRWLIEGAIESTAAAELVRVFGLGMLEVETERPPPVEAPGQAGATPMAATRAAASTPPRATTPATSTGLGSTVSEVLFTGDILAAVQGVAEVITFGDDIQSFGVLGMATCDTISCSGAGVVGTTSTPHLPGVLGEGPSYGVRGIGRFGVQGNSTHSLGAGGDFYNGLGKGVRIRNNAKGRDLAALWVENIETSQGMAGYLKNESAFATAHFANSGAGQVLYLQNGGTNDAGSGGGNFIEARNNSEGDIQFRVASDGTAYSDTSFNGGGADFAEMMPAVESLSPGEVVAARGDGLVERSGGANQTSVIGVVSTAPGFVGGLGAGDEIAGRVPIAIVGIVPVRASAENGAISAGDLLVAAGTPGHAMRAGDAPPRGAVLGKALEPLADGLGTIRLLVMAQ